MLCIIGHQGNANQNHDDMPHYTHKDEVINREFPGPVVQRTPLQGTWVQSLVRELIKVIK